MTSLGPVRSVPGSLGDFFSGSIKDWDKMCVKPAPKAPARQSCRGSPGVPKPAELSSCSAGAAGTTKGHSNCSSKGFGFFFLPN